MNIGNWISKWSRLFPSKTAIVFEGNQFTYRELNERVNRFSHSLIQLGVRRRDRVGVFLGNCNQFLEVFFALSKIGAILVPLNTRLAISELEYVLNDSGTTALVFESKYTETIQSLMLVVAIDIDKCICVGGDCDFAQNYENVIKHQATTEPQMQHAVGDEDPHVIMYTSGTTGVPKGAILSHRKTFFNALNADIYYGLTPRDILIVSRALFHSGGLLVEAAPMLYKGGTLIMKRKFSPTEILETIQNYKVTILEAPATVLRFIFEQCDLQAYDLASLKCCFTGGERVPPTLLADFRAKGIPLSQIYGQTETSTITWLPIDDAGRKLGSVGVPVFHGDVKIVDPDGNAVGPNEIGEIVVSGDIVMSGYWGNQKATQAAIVNGWLHTGDLATADDEGFFYIVDRAKDMYISGGENVYPAEIEKMFLQNSDILNAAVVGVPDKKWGEVGVVFVVLKEGASMSDEEVIQFCDGKIARYKIPKFVRFVSQLPMTAAQKIKRNKLREVFLKENSNP